MKIFLFASLFLVSSLANAGQFGLEKGESIAAIRAKTKLTQVKPYVYSAAKLPNGHPAFDDYRLLITPVHGLCKIQAWTPAIETNAYGEAVETKFSNLYSALESKYGSNKKFDFLQAGSIWNEPRDWMMGLAKEERTLAAFWDREEKSDLPEDLYSIKLEANGISSSAALIQLTYEFTNSSDCIAWLKNQENSSL